MNTPSPFIDPLAFSKASVAWTDAVLQGGSLKHLFQIPAEPLEAKLQYAVFSVQDMISLVSTVGAHYIKAQFLRLPDQAGTAPFTIALWALDSQRGRISAYFLGANGSTELGSVQPSPTDPGGSGALPIDLATAWLTNWQTAEDITADMFNTNYGPLQGYIFELDDFIDPLFPIKLTESHQLRVYFALHTYQQVLPDGAQTATTFGLVLSVQEQTATQLPRRRQRNSAMQAADGDEAFYDLSHPNPPGMAAGS